MRHWEPDPSWWVGPQYDYRGKAFHYRPSEGVNCQVLRLFLVLGVAVRVKV